MISLVAKVTWKSTIINKINVICYELKKKKRKLLGIWNMSFNKVPLE